MKANGIDILRDEREILAGLENDQEIAADLETSGLHPHKEKIAVVTLYGEESGTLGVLHLRGRKVPDGVKRLLENPDKRITWHNGVSFDIPFMMAAGVDASRTKIYDTMVGAGVAITSDRAFQAKSLQAEIERRFKVTIEKSANHSSWMNPELDNKQLLYCAEDILHLHALRRAQHEQVAKFNAIPALELEMAIVGSVARMTHNGLPICVPKLDEYKQKRHQDMVIHVAELYRRFPEMDNVGSATQVKAVLRNLGCALPMKWDPIKKVRKETTQANAIEAMHMRGVHGLVANGQIRQQEGESSEAFTRRAELIIETLNHVLRARECKKTGESYSDEWLEKWTVHRPQDSHGLRWVYPKFRQTGTDTLRFSSSEPNFQQWPKVMRGIIGGAIEGATPEPLDIVAIDYSQIEVVIAAYNAKDPVLLPHIEAGGDIHRFVASMVFGKEPDQISKYERQVAKACSFCLIFGGEATTLMEYAIGYGAVLSLQESRALVINFFNRFPGLARQKAEAQALAAQGRNLVEIRLANGGVRHLLGYKISPTVILNTNVQGNAAAGMKYAIYEAKKQGLDKYFGATVHDELIAVVPRKWSAQYAEALEACMIKGMRRVVDSPGVRVEATVSPFWG